MTSMFPEGLTDKEFSLLKSCSKEAAGLTPQVLLKGASGHLEKVRHAHARNVFVNRSHRVRRRKFEDQARQGH